MKELFSVALTRLSLVVMVALLTLLIGSGTGYATEYFVDQSASNDSATFAGARCGDVSYAAVQLPAGAIKVAPQSLKVGDGLQDGQYNEGTVARIVAVGVSANGDGTSQVVWAAQGSFAACTDGTLSSITGWMTSPVALSADYQLDAGSRVVWRSARNGTDAVRPRFHYALSDTHFDHMHWPRWGGPVAIGRGYVVNRDYVATGNGRYRRHDLFTPAIFRLSQVTYCSDDSTLIYGRLQVHLLRRIGGRDIRFGGDYNCAGQVDGGNIY